jgi:hypothetical protein
MLNNRHSGLDPESSLFGYFSPYLPVPSEGRAGINHEKYQIIPLPLRRGRVRVGVNKIIF